MGRAGAVDRDFEGVVVVVVLRGGVRDIIGLAMLEVRIEPATEAPDLRVADTGGEQRLKTGLPDKSTLFMD